MSRSGLPDTRVESKQVSQEAHESAECTTEESAARLKPIDLTRIVETAEDASSPETCRYGAYPDWPVIVSAMRLGGILMESENWKVDPDTLPCPVCGVTVRRDAASNTEGNNIDDPMLATPVARLYAVAAEAGVVVGDIPPDESDGFAGAVAVGFDERSEMHGMVYLAEDLDDDLRADVLAFGIAVLVGDSACVVDTPNRCIGIGRERLPAARKGVGHLAWHMLRSCGRDTYSATFELVSV